VLADTTSLHEDLGLQQSLAFARFTLHVIHDLIVFNVGIEAEDHQSKLCSSVVENMLARNNY
jgi:hypothetical protein